MNECGLICFTFLFPLYWERRKTKLSLICTLPLNAIPDFGTKPKRFVSLYLLISTTWGVTLKTMDPF
ncbi:hypothetical protein VNO78_00534 [Psophocarpus tetragonolobus]|uniref:Uncharacterized protein n=1 Tax=Psophocarpus tetragonolobus TaxID=3891 RepID=A0AAN9XV24_PSOTE